jgi:hypothetical protein
MFRPQHRSTLGSFSVNIDRIDGTLSSIPIVTVSNEVPDVILRRYSRFGRNAKKTFRTVRTPPQFIKEIDRLLVRFALTPFLLKLASSLEERSMPSFHGVKDNLMTG